MDEREWGPERQAIRNGPQGASGRYLREPVADTPEVAKWALFLGIGPMLYGTRWFWGWVFGLPAAGLATHLLYRRMTQGSTRPWGRWKDVEAARPRSET
jgi:hypothetical protein